MIFKIILIALIGVVVVLVLRTAKPEFAVFATIATGVVIVIILLSTLQNVILSFDEIVKKSGVDDGIFTAVLKIIGIGYLTEYSASIANDAGCGSIASKLQFGGKLTIFTMSISIVSTLIDVIKDLVNMI